MNKHFVFSNLLTFVVLLAVITSVFSCSDSTKADPVKEKILKVNNKKSNKPSCCANGIPARFPVKSIVER